jgi:hypothetical protein
MSAPCGRGVALAISRHILGEIVADRLMGVVKFRRQCLQNSSIRSMTIAALQIIV